MKTAFSRVLAILTLGFLAHASFAETDASIKASVEPGIAKLKPLLGATANGLPLDVVVINYTQPQDNVVINQLMPINVTIGAQMSSRAYTENYSKGDCVEVKFTYNNGSLFDQLVYRRSTISVFKTGIPQVAQFGGSCGK